MQNQSCPSLLREMMQKIEKEMDQKNEIQTIFELNEYDRTPQDYISRDIDHEGDN